MAQPIRASEFYGGNEHVQQQSEKIASSLIARR
jgi:hypothetical protein